MGNKIKFTTKQKLCLENNLYKYFISNNINYNLIKNDAYEIAKQLDFDVKKSDLQSNMFGLLLIDENKKFVSDFNKPKAILVNMNKTKKENNFTIAYELSHYIFDKMLKYNKKTIIGDILHYNDWYRDTEYNNIVLYIALLILIPNKSIKIKLEEFNSKYETMDKTLESLSDFYNVSKEIIELKFNFI